MTGNDLPGQIQGISLDLDDTLWAVMPVIHRAEKRIQRWFQRRFPDRRNAFSADRFRHYRKRVDVDEPQWSHDLTRQRARAFEIMLLDLQLDANVAEIAVEKFLAWRQDVDLFPGVEKTLAALARRYRLVTLSNGNADVHRIGIGRYFEATISASTVGARKPQARMFNAACETLALEHRQILHIGDHPVDDIAGAAAAGMKTLWIKHNQSWNQDTPEPDLQVCVFSDLLNWLE